MSEPEEPPITKVFLLVADLALALGVRSIKDLAGCWTYRSDDLFVAVNGQQRPQLVKTPDSGALTLDPYNVAIFIKGWLVHLGHPHGGWFMGMMEEEVIEHLEKLLEEVKA